MSRLAERRVRPYVGCARLGQIAGEVIDHAEAEQEEQEEDGRNNDELGESFAGVFHMHEKEDDEQGFRGGNAEGDDGIQGTEIDEGDGRGDDGEDHEGDPDAVVHAGGHGVGVGVVCVGVVMHGFGSFKRFSVNQIKQWEKINPDNVNEVPVEAAQFDGGIVLRPVSAFPGLDGQINKQAHADDHV